MRHMQYMLYGPKRQTRCAHVAPRVKVVQRRAGRQCGVASRSQLTRHSAAASGLSRGPWDWRRALTPTPPTYNSTLLGINQRSFVSPRTLILLAAK